MTGLQIWELIFALMNGIGGIGSVIVGIKKEKGNPKTEKNEKEES